MDDTNVNDTEPIDGTTADDSAEESADDSTAEAPSSNIEERLAALEQRMTELVDTLDPKNAVHRERAMHAERHATVPFERPNMPPGLSPNDILAHHRVTGSAPIIEEPSKAEVDTDEEEETKHVPAE